MTLGFKENFPWKEPTYFREKILAGVGHLIINGDNIKPGPIEEDGFKPKLHTMRLDPHDRWKAGRSIQMVYRGPKYSIKDHFNKGIPELEKCVSTQKMEIKWEETNEVPVGVFWTGFGEGVPTKIVTVTVDQKLLTQESIRTLAINDGFDSVEYFFRWFNKDWEGKIIHFSSLRY